MQLYCTETMNVFHCSIFLRALLSGDIFENLGVRISDPWKKCVTRKILFWLEKSKKDHRRGSEGMRLQSTLFLRSMFPFTSSKCSFILRIALLFSRISFHFPELPFYFPELPFCFPELPFCFPEVSFFSKMLYCFPE